jgi:hypothetical protein
MEERVIGGRKVHKLKPKPSVNLDIRFISTNPSD